MNSPTSRAGCMTSAAPPRVRRFAGLPGGVTGNEGRLRLAPEAAAARVAIGQACGRAQVARSFNFCDTRTIEKINRGMF